MAAFYNQATLSFNGNVLTSNITAGEIVGTLSVTKDAVIQTYAPESGNVYVINITNNGQADVTGLTLTDDLGSYETGDVPVNVVPLTYSEGTVRYYVNGIEQPAPTVSSASALTFTGISVPAGGNAVIVYAVRTNEYAPYGEGASITNTVTVSGNGISDVTASAVTTPSEEPVLAISKSLSPATVEENGTVTYTFIIQNTGSTATTAADDIVFSDVFTPVLSALTAEFNGTEWTEGTEYTYDQTTGEFTSAEGVISVPAAVYTQDPATGAWTVQPGISTLVITGKI
ncbi:MAG: hypothetical protein IKO47_00745 [Ruminococcus sp.]|nr:hypothetical protein [Ruminococcus sp.]